MSLIKSPQASRGAAEERPYLGPYKEQHTVINECPITLPRQEAAPDCCKKDNVSTVWPGLPVSSLIVQRECPSSFKARP